MYFKSAFGAAAILFMAGSSAFAGLPSQDPEVARLQKEFSEAKTPTLAELELGKLWKCSAVNAVKDHMERYSGSDYRFEERMTANGVPFLLEMVAFEMVQNHQVDAASVSFVYRFAEGHFMGQPYDDPSITRVHTYLRMTSDGRLLVEIASYLYPELPQPIFEQRMSLSVPASVFPELRLMGYEECRVQK